MWPNIVYLNTQGAFNRAIASGRLSRNSSASNYAGRYMYMGTWSGQDQFKHADTRQYLGQECPDFDHERALRASIGAIPLSNTDMRPGKYW